MWAQDLKRVSRARVPLFSSFHRSDRIPKMSCKKCRAWEVIFFAVLEACFTQVRFVDFAVCPDMSPIFDALLRTIGKAGGRIKRGTALHSGHERELQGLVDKLSKIVGDV